MHVVGSSYSSTDIAKLLKELSPEDKNHPFVKHSLHIREADALSNYHAFIKLYHTTPNHGRHLLSNYLIETRIRALQVIAKAYATGCFVFTGTDINRPMSRWNGSSRSWVLKTYSNAGNSSEHTMHKLRRTLMESRFLTPKHPASCLAYRNSCPSFWLVLFFFMC